jgi:hypothetical protein
MLTRLLVRLVTLKDSARISSRVRAVIFRLRVMRRSVVKYGNSAQGRKVADCFISEMSKAGAPADAVNFTRDLSRQSHGDIGIMTGFNKVGPVDIAWVRYPTHEPGNYGLLLVNGEPKLVNAEDLKQLDQKGMQQSFQFQDLKNQFPKVALFAGDRDGKTWPNSQAGPNGGVQFTLGYPLRNGCRPAPTRDRRCLRGTSTPAESLPARHSWDSRRRH